jgi:hypothetical protein
VAERQKGVRPRRLFYSAVEQRTIATIENKADSQGLVELS